MRPSAGSIKYAASPLPAITPRAPLTVGTNAVVGKIIEGNNTACPGQRDWLELVVRGDLVRVQLRCCKKNRERGDRAEHRKVECGFTVGFHRTVTQILCNEIAGEEAISYSVPILPGIMIRKMGDPFTFFSGKEARCVSESTDTEWLFGPTFTFSTFSSFPLECLSIPRPTHTRHRAVASRDQRRGHRDRLQQEHILDRMVFHVEYQKFVIAFTRDIGLSILIIDVEAVRGSPPGKR